MFQHAPSLVSGIMSELGNWYRNIPEITRYWFTGSFVLPLLGKLGLINPEFMYLSWEAIYDEYEIWRVVTSLFFYHLSPNAGFHWLIMLYFLYTYSESLETGIFFGRPADYVFLVIFNWILCVILSLAAGVPFLLDSMVMSIIYIWAQLNKDQIVQFWFGIRFKAMYLPWMLIAFNMILHEHVRSELIGILIGHTYYFVMLKYPQDFGGSTIFSTPQFLYNWFPTRLNSVGSFGVAPTHRPERQDWGRGQPLGN